VFRAVVPGLGILLFVSPLCEFDRGGRTLVCKNELIEPDRGIDSSVSGLASMT
jgi:hypothetical protein